MYQISVERTEDGRYIATNERGARIEISGDGAGPHFSPVELLLVAVAGCNIVTTEPLTAQRGHRMPTLIASATSEKVERNKLGPVTLSYSVTLPAGDADAEKVFRDVAERVEERHCTVSRSLREGTPVNLVLDDVS
ncbi:MAG: osmotically inducible protein C [Catenulispora sp. 13_1_20CM_3_70_7]|jgi:putative redox protein|nr:OsmC family protein [Catenulisporales bacterium]OLE20689.1 MAG: osmotically inducible protein C [Catenulispora sp. 13_1_20CM_3_70_7]